ncbi:membrane protein-like protein [Nitrosospira multiformis ATCC 25196]|uniref:Membrane protein-like protein n=1 Tax=Nitrosospira multiformis (strain ATCC 25196 / NCIMB 11849 / C 71) TaxID=323848 RepID=Q2Y991_NITMU|nr:DUF1269 domain-containing protein [Nitrosospira multiformis]ABB74680.1 membrane protein-like protein [Nitrosospira multiformis ATCC 25196]
MHSASGQKRYPALADYGINDDFIKSLSETIPLNSSALFILVRNAQPEKGSGGAHRR